MLDQTPLKMQINDTSALCHLTGALNGQRRKHKSSQSDFERRGWRVDADRLGDGGVEIKRRSNKLELCALTTSGSNFPTQSHFQPWSLPLPPAQHQLPALLFNHAYRLYYRKCGHDLRTFTHTPMAREGT